MKNSSWMTLILMIIVLGAILSLTSKPVNWTPLITVAIVGLALYLLGRSFGRKREKPTHFEDSPTVRTVQKETIIERQIVKVKCRYCGTLNNDGNTACESCGARL